MDLSRFVRTVPDFPKPGILFRDVTTLFEDAGAFGDVIEGWAERYRSAGLVRIAGIEARGFVLGGALARALGIGFLPVRKRGKLPGETRSRSYALEYGSDCLEIRKGAVAPGDRLVVVDDLIATGGTARATCELLQEDGAIVVELAAIIDLPDLGGSALLRQLGLPVTTRISFEGH